jgi:hypothetical protein
VAPDPVRGDERERLEERWLNRTRTILPALAAPCGWPIRFDHCFQRVLLDCAFGGVWYHHVRARPAYRVVPLDALARAVALGEAVAAGGADLVALNARSLAWRAEARQARRRG